VAEEASWLTPRLSLAAADESAIAPNDFVALLVHHLSTAAPAWDPYPLTAANADAE
jgi:hypothetical protein